MLFGLRRCECTTNERCLIGGDPALSLCSQDTTHPIVKSKSLRGMFVLLPLMVHQETNEQHLAGSTRRVGRMKEGLDAEMN